MVSIYADHHRGHLAWWRSTLTSRGWTRPSSNQSPTKGHHKADQLQMTDAKPISPYHHPSMEEDLKAMLELV